MVVDLNAVAAEACAKHGASQIAEELAEALALVQDIDPRVIVEIGCDSGGTLYAWSQICARVYGITLEVNDYASGGSNHPLTRHGADVRIGDSHNYESYHWLTQKLDGHKISALIIDGDHSLHGVYNDIAMYAPLVRRGGLVLIHDITVTRDPRCMVWKAWPEFHDNDQFDTAEIVSMSDRRIGWGVIYVKGGEPWD